jgi:cullin-4
MNAYTVYRRENPPPSSSRSNIDSHFQLLTTGYWPSYPSTNSLIVPPELQHIMEHFNTFYTAKYQGRRLAWAHHVERCLIIANFPKGKKDLEVSFIQALVLLCFNRVPSIGFLDIKSATGIIAINIITIIIIIITL